MAGVEIAGVTLALLPLFLNQLDNYVQGLETLKGFRTRRYRRELHGYLTNLTTQHAILLNTLEQVLEGVVDYEEEIDKLIHDPLGPSWSNGVFQERLRKKLGRDHNTFVNAVTGLSMLVKETCTRLGVNPSGSLEIEWNDASVVDREIKKLKDIFSKSIYNTLLDKIESANSALKTLAEQSQHREQFRKKQKGSRKPLLKHITARKLANSLYNAIVRGNCWTCSCKNQRCVHLQLTCVDNTDPHSESPKFRMAFSSKPVAAPTCLSWSWQEIEIEPIFHRPQLQETKSAPLIDNMVRERKVKFAVATSPLDTLPWPQVQDATLCSPISDMCSALCAVKIESQQRAPIGFVMDGVDTSHQHNLYLVKKLAKTLDTQSLEDLLASSPRLKGPRTTHRGFLLTRKDRLYLAATLACSVFQFHGSWLKTQWRTRDILFEKSDAGCKISVNRPYLSSHPLNNASSETNTSESPGAVSALIRNEILFPLGLALVELSLCETIAALRTPEDEDRLEAVADLKTASRVLDEVRDESGDMYRDVVDKCLNWPGPRNAQLDDEEFHASVFENIVLPLLKGLGDFEGRALAY
ncbi:hypothetical protein FQN50_006144 [Emmonsiellopsis sp. PD_5]|nr:hypothetical protein FQN50_006144 [Emmonsiellopsis sp. PD_5]